MPIDQVHLSQQMRLLLEELCCEICRFEHAFADAVEHDHVKIDREFYLGKKGKFADIRVSPGQSPPYLVEVKYGYSVERLCLSLRRKYSESLPSLEGVKKIILVTDLADSDDWPAVRRKIIDFLPGGLTLDVWGGARVSQLLKDRFGTETTSITPETLLEVRQAIDRAQGFFAFGGESVGHYQHDPLKAELLWHFGFWKIRQLREARQLQPRDIFPPGLYKNVVVLLADLCSFSSYVRDTPDEEVVRDCLTSFYSKARYQIIGNGGMFYQFVGDEVIAMFGIPDKPSGFVKAALDTAMSLINIGNSVSHDWQQKIDREQSSSGVHIGMAIGDIQIVSLRPYSRMHFGAIADSINVAARLMSIAGSGEIAVSNSFLRALDENEREMFREIETLEAKNVGKIKAWKYALSED